MIINRCQLMRNNILLLRDRMTRILVTREMDRMDNVNFNTSFRTIFVSDYTDKCGSLPKKIDSNGILIKIIFFVLFFSSNCSILHFDHPYDSRSPSESRTVFLLTDTKTNVLIIEHIIHPVVHFTILIDIR